ncbi:MAG: acetyl-CoA C-acyltransferase, partial [Balneolaceae bacterium]
VSYDLARMAIQGLLGRTGLSGDLVDMVIMGTVLHNPDAYNIAREATLGSSLPPSVPAFTTSMACISSNIAVTNAIEQIRTGQADIIITGGTDTMSDLPIRFRKPIRKRILQARKAKSAADWWNLLKGLRPKDFLPEVPTVSEFSTGVTMGESCDQMAAKYGVTREEQDKYALQSHQRAARATQNGLLTSELFPTLPPETDKPVETDNTIRGDSTLEQMAKLPPAFGGKYGTVTAGNASPLTDGASAALLMSSTRAGDLSYTPRARFRSYVYTAQQPDDELLIGPATAIPKLLEKEGITLQDIDIFEFHEAFAGQVLSVLTALNSDQFARDRLGRSERVGEVPMDKLNTRGGSLSLGHPFGATGVRLVTTAANRLHEEDGTLALVAACAAGGQGHAILLERI